MLSGLVMTTTQQAINGRSVAALQREGSSLLRSARALLQACDCQRVHVTVDGAGVLEMVYQLMLTQHGHGGLLMIPMEMPLLTPALLRGLQEVGLLTGRPCTYLDNRLPAFLPVNQALCAMVHQQLMCGNRGSMQTLFQHVGAIQLVCQQPSALTQITDEAAWAKRLKAPKDTPPMHPQS